MPAAYMSETFEPGSKDVYKRQDIIRYFAGYPVMTADGFKPPDLLRILKSNAVHFISAVLFKQAAEAFDTFTGTANIRQNQAYNIFLADTAFNLFLFIFGRLIRCV